ncbi:MAG: phosphoadenylyl-sulfate reductase [Terriglobales bacterium]
MIENLEETQILAETWNPEEVLQWAFQTFGNRVEMASGFGAEGMALIDIATRLNPALRVFTVDTEFLFSETYQLIEKVEERYGITVERVRPRLTPEAQAEIYGSALWTSNPDQCCALRKVEPLKEKLAGLRAWITAIRRDQTSARATARKVEWDPKFQLVKINPIADWTTKDVWNYLHAHNVPYNPLHDANYTSIGCTHCTRAILPGEDARAGRWAGFQKTECGLHIADPPLATSPLVQLSLAGDPEPCCS